MKSEKVIDKVEKEVKELKNRFYCEGEAIQGTIPGRNYVGVPGFVSTVYCKGCHRMVSAFGESARAASVMARSYWNRGINDGVATND